MTDINGSHYDYAIDPLGNATANKVLRLVGEGKQVLELGCGPGAMTRFMRERLNCTITAVEFDPELAELARPYCEQLLVGDLEALDFDAAFGDRQFQVAIAADVLEHLRDPWRCLRALRERLTADGFLIVSIPNIAHNGVILQLLNGRFPYRDKGLLDRTHLRFFGREDIDELLLSCGFMPAVWERSVVAEQHTEFESAWRGAAPALREALAANIDGQVYQFIVKAYPSSETGWLSKTRAENEDYKLDNQRLEQRLADTQDSLREYQKAFHEARQLLEEKEQKLAEYADAFHQAREQLGQREAALDDVNKAFGEARQIIEKLDAEQQALARSLPVRLSRRLGRLLGRR